MPELPQKVYSTDTGKTSGHAEHSFAAVLAQSTDGFAGYGLKRSAGTKIPASDCQKTHFSIAEGFGKRSVSRLESAGQASLVRGKGRVSRLSAFFQKADGMNPFIPTVPQKRLEGVA